MVLLLFGPPGCGKGTQSRLITNWLHIPAISTGEMLRAEIRAGSAYGQAASSIMASGGLVSDGLVNEMLVARVSQPDCESGVLLDGYPRTVEQAEFLDGVLADRKMPPALVLHLDVPNAALIGRMSSRRQCTVCSRVYNMLHEPPKTAGVCDDDAMPLITRKDDREEVVRARLEMYDEVTRPVLAHYQHRNYHQIQGDRSPSYIFEVIQAILDRQLGRNGHGH